MANFNGVVDGDQQWLLNCLFWNCVIQGCCKQGAPVRIAPDILLLSWFFSLSIVFIIFLVHNKNVMKIGAAVLLKLFIKKHWHEGEEAFEHPAVSSDEKVVVRRLLLLSLDDSHRKICTAVSMAVASIAAYDWPEDWPDLLPYLLKLISDHNNMNGVHGALRCLALLSVDLDDTVVPTLVPALFPCLLNIVSSPQVYDKYLRTKSLSIVYSCISMLGVMSGVYKTETSALIMPMIKPWMDQFSTILNHPVQSEDPDDWSIRTEVLKCLNQFVQNFPSLIESEFMRPLWQTFMSSLGVYVRSSIEGTEDPYDDRYDSDGAEKSLDSFVIQLFEFLLTIVGSAKLITVIMNNVKELTYNTIGFLQITEQQVHTWSMDANQFVADEDDVTYSCRVSGALLLEEVVNSCGTEGLCAIIDAAKRCFSESQREKDVGSAIWWRIREAALFALSSLSDQLLEAEESELTRVGLGNLLEQVITEDSGLDVHQYPFLYSRIFSSVAKFSSVISHGVLEHFLFAAIKAIGMDVPPPVKVGACRALSELLPEMNKGIIQPHLMSLFSSLSELLSQASDETLHLVLETLQEAIKAGYELSVSIEPVISPVVLNMWASHISDPFISIDAIEVLETLKNAPGCIRPLVSRVLPCVWPVINQSAGITTRSKAKLTPDQWTVVPLPAKIMALLADALVEILEQGAGDNEQDSDWEEVEAEDGELDKDLMYSAGVTSFGRPSHEHLEAIAKTFDKDEEDSYEDDQLSAADPLNKINLANYLAEFFVNFSQSERQMFDHLFQSLTQDQRNAIQAIRTHGG
ncbi:hypothetical protein C1H46_026550 [Malus baccata]|uniref:Importin N-terminal domain-containing protein n=1 Tax=Malus baccata TaxID=106549 RepID=A0A540LN63_MALBA|nr:hypothetical protein C1H46_026550 [Malus baccata]